MPFPATSIPMLYKLGTPVQLCVRRVTGVLLDSAGVQWYGRCMSAQYVSDETGRRTAVLLPLEEYERLLEDLQDLASIAERREEPTVSHEDLVAELKRDGLLPT